MVKGIWSGDSMNDDEIKREKIRNLLTPDVAVCGGCREEFKEVTSCAACGTNMLDPGYKGMTYECPVCGRLYCERCWNKGAAHAEEHEHAKKEGKGIFH
jgi:predicted RNA-binding Zn-ribbon protein involved in translation (DUF1610 family)